MKKMAYALAAFAVVSLALVSCGTGAAAAGKKIGMVTDAGTIDDKSFNQGTWEGILKAGTDLKVETKYLKPTGTTEADYVKEIGNLYDAGFKFIVTPGFKFSGAIFTAQEKYKDAKFVIIDSQPAGADGAAVVAANTVAIFFAEQQSGFIAGVAAAAQVKEGDFGFVGGMEIPPVQKYNWGFQQGVAYANANLGTKITIKAENVIYQGTFSDVAAGQQLAAQMYDKGVKAIFAAAGGVGVGVINEAKARAAKGVWVVGVDVDQYSQGEYEAGKSIILTSAMKKIDQATFDTIKAETEGKFPGGQTLTFDASNDGIGIPATNPNLSEEAAKAAADALAKVKAGEVKVAAEKGDLIK
jgi:basic membrane protein A